MSKSLYQSNSRFNRRARLVFRVSPFVISVFIALLLAYPDVCAPWALYVATAAGVAMLIAGACLLPHILSRMLAGYRQAYREVAERRAYTRERIARMRQRAEDEALIIASYWRHNELELRLTLIRVHTRLAV